MRIPRPIQKPKNGEKESEEHQTLAQFVLQTRNHKKNFRILSLKFFLDPTDNKHKHAKKGSEDPRGSNFDTSVIGKS